ncbi:MAG: serpin family protein [Streptosporangiaceae bacterium]
MQDQSATLTAAAEADDAFGADLYGLLTEDSAQTVFSPASVASALQMTLCGARGDTAAELARALHLGGPAAASDGLSLLTELLGEVTARGLVTFRAPNTMWVQSGLALLPGFTAQLRDAAAVAVRDADFAAAPEAARSEINRVIAEQTAGKIADLLPPGSINRLSRLVLANAVYLKAAWAQTFDEKATGDAAFYPDGPDAAGVTVRMMHGTAVRSYLSRDGYQAVLMPYADARLAMAVVLPDGPLATLRPIIAADGLRGLLAGATRHLVTLSLPRFRLEAQFDLIPALRQLGVRRAFTGAADFGGITEGTELTIGTIAHKAYIDVNERGTEAAAATAVGFPAAAAMRLPPKVTLTVDRPFLFAIVDTPTGLPLFLGQVSHPRVP